MNPNLRKKEPSRTTYAVGFLVNLVVLFLVHQHEVWRPLLGGVVTKEWIDVLWIVNFSLGVQLFGNAVLFLFRRLWLRRVVNLATSLMGVLSTIVFYRVYPFDFSMFVEGIDVAFRVVLLLALLGSAIASLVNLVLLLVLLQEDPPSRTLRPRESH